MKMDEIISKLGDFADSKLECWELWYEKGGNVITFELNGKKYKITVEEVKE